MIYAVNTDWWSREDRKAKARLYLGGRCYEIQIPRDRITQIMIRGDIAAVTSDMETEILDIRREGDTCVVKKQGIRLKWRLRIWRKWSVFSLLKWRNKTIP